MERRRCDGKSDRLQARKRLSLNRKPDLAVEALKKLSNINEHCPKTLLKRGQLFAKHKMFDNALEDFNKSANIDPTSAETYMIRGTFFARLGKFDEAENDFNTVVALKPRFADAYYNRALIYQKKSYFDKAILDYTSAIKIDENHIGALNNRGLSYREKKQYRDALSDFDSAITLKPSFAQAHWNKALTHLMTGDYPNAWIHFEERWNNPSFTSQKRPFTEPLWLGENSLENKKILLHSEQGLGDSIQYCRYVLLVKKIAGAVYLEVEQPLERLMQTLLPPKQIFLKGSKLPQFDFHCPLMSLPLCFHTTIDTVPFSKPYLKISKTRIAWWKNHLHSLKGLKVGVVWQGNPKHPNDKKRSIPLEMILEELNPEFKWVSLQKELSAKDTEIIQKQNFIMHYGDLIGDFFETGALCKALDAIVCVDTSIAHLAGAIGKDVYLALPYLADSRWHENRNESPWYSSIRLYRQEENRCWRKPIREIIKDLSKITQQNVN